MNLKIKYFIIVIKNSKVVLGMVFMINLKKLVLNANLLWTFLHFAKYEFSNVKPDINDKIIFELIKYLSKEINHFFNKRIWYIKLYNTI